MECTDIRGRLDAYADGELDRRSARAVEDHISVCGECRERVDALRLINDRLRASALQPGEIHDFADAVMAQLPDRAEKRMSAAPRLRWAWAACVLVAIAVAFWGLSVQLGHRTPPQILVHRPAPVKTLSPSYAGNGLEKVVRKPEAPPKQPAPAAPIRRRPPPQVVESPVRQGPNKFAKNEPGKVTFEREPETGETIKTVAQRTGDTVKIEMESVPTASRAPDDRSDRYETPLAVYVSG